MVGNIILISAHILDHLDEDGRGQTVITESMNYVNNIKHRFKEEFDVIVGVDANATLPANYENTTGGNVLPPAKSHSAAMQRIILAWFSALGVCALNTVPSTYCSVDGDKNAGNL